MDEKIKVIALDDDVMSQLLVMDILEEAGFEALPASKISDAEDILNQFGRQIQGIVADNSLYGEKQGWAFAKKLHLQGMPAIIISGSRPTEAEAIEFKDLPFVPKPIYDRVLIQKAKEVFTVAKRPIVVKPNRSKLSCAILSRA